MNIIYQKFYIQKIFTLNEASKIIKNKQVCKNTLTRLVQSNQLKRLRNNLYNIVPLDNPDFYPDPIHIASKLKPDAILSCNTALYASGLIKEDIKNVFIYSKHALRTRIGPVTYKIIRNKQNFGTKKIEYNTGYGVCEIQTTDLERTIIDCIRTRTLKLEEIIQILKNPKIQLDMSRIINYLEKYKKPILYNKTGLILDTTKTFTRIPEEDIDKIRKKLTKKIYYAREKGIRLIRPRYKYYGKWNIMITEQLYEQIIPKTTI
ncbi:MAG: type IV toxin-antitoxin system AbiEi family antitoxin domain-containing protein [Candidatus Woesearchaeota archaeon]